MGSRMDGWRWLLQVLVSLVVPPPLFMVTHRLFILLCKTGKIPEPHSVLKAWPQVVQASSIVWLSEYLLPGPLMRVAFSSHRTWLF
uniref:Putative secreted protein n=1 Tax=Amblyomma cajennense TaxID=34607 RepID=A0A023FD62_AMBCJ